MDSEYWTRVFTTLAIILVIKGVEGGFRDDTRCGPEFLLSDGSPAGCDPNSNLYCCSDYGWCGNGTASCDCPTCINYKEVERGFRDDGRCGPKYPLSDGSRAGCDPYSDFFCCSDHGWCGNGSDWCDCPTCINYKEVERGFRDDTRCGPEHPLSDGSPAGCDPNSDFYCCSDHGWCGNGSAWCDCPTCINYKDIHDALVEVNRTQKWGKIDKSLKFQPFMCSKIQTNDMSDPVDKISKNRKLSSIKIIRNGGDESSSNKPSTSLVISDPPTSAEGITTTKETSILDMTDVSTKNQTEPTIDSTTSVTCPSGYSTTLNNSCYRISNDTDRILSRSDARKLCESESSHLVFIESAEEDAFLMTVMLPDEQYWIGANGLPYNFYWDDGSVMEYNKFAEEEEVAFDDGRGCYRMRIEGGNTTWSDAPCFRKYNYICEYEEGQETKECPDDISICGENQWTELKYEWETTKTELQDSVLAYFDGGDVSLFKPLYASRGIHSFVYRSNDSSNDWCSFRLVTDCMKWNRFPGMDISHALVPNWLRWHEAVKACIFYDSHLVSVEDVNKNTSLQSLISNATTDYWIGLRYSADTGEWKPVRPNSTQVFFNWAHDQPNMVHSCVVIDHVTALWETKSCGSSAPFVCERRKDE